MKPTKSFSFEEFKDKVSSDREFAKELSTQNDSIDFDNGTMTIHRGNLMKYLEQYLCKSEADLEDTLWYNYGIFVKVID